jgi:hypothetical protein
MSSEMFFLGILTFAITRFAIKMVYPIDAVKLPFP